MGFETMVGLLRGAAPPPEAVLQDLFNMHPLFRVSWWPEVKTPEVGIIPGHWRLDEERPNTAMGQLRRDAGLARAKRYEGFSQIKQLEQLGMLYESEHMMKGHYFVGDYTTEEFGTEHMLSELRAGQEIALSEMRKMEYVKEGTDMDEADIEDEVKTNEEYAERVRDVAKDFWHQVFHKTQVQVGEMPQGD